MSEFQQEFLDKRIGNGEYEGTVAEAMERCPVFQNLGITAVETLVETYAALSEIDEQGNQKSEEEVTKAEANLVAELLALKTAKQKHVKTESTTALETHMPREKAPEQSFPEAVIPVADVAVSVSTVLENAVVEVPEAQYPILIEQARRQIERKPLDPVIEIPSDLTAYEAVATFKNTNTSDEVTIPDFPTLELSHQLYAPATQDAGKDIGFTSPEITVPEDLHPIAYTEEPPTESETFEHATLEQSSSINVIEQPDNFYLTRLEEIDTRIAHILDDEIPTGQQTEPILMDTAEDLYGSFGHEEVTLEPIDALAEQIQHALEREVPELEPCVAVMSDIITTVTNRITEGSDVLIDTGESAIEIVNALISEGVFPIDLAEPDRKRYTAMIEQVLETVFQLKSDINLATKNRLGTSEHMIRQAWQLVRADQKPASLRLGLGRFALHTAVA